MAKKKVAKKKVTKKVAKKKVAKKKVAKEELIKPNDGDLKILKKIEDLLGKKLEQVKEIVWDTRGYSVNTDGAVTRLGLYDLNIEDKKFEKIVEIVTTLTSLTGLDLSVNLMTDISALSSLTSLTWLNLFNNELSDISALSSLTSLTELDLCNNELTDISALSSLLSLIWLNLNSNELTDISALSSLTSLTKLDLCNNKIRELPEWITQWGIEINYGDSIYGKGIGLENNPLERPPMAIVKQGKEAIRRYFRQLSESEAKTQKDYYLFEAKLLIIGEAGAGKTTFARKLKDPNAKMPKPEDTTRGIDVYKWDFEITKDDFPKLEGLGLDKARFFLNLWDFGGQEIYHGTHQFFFSKDSLYILLGDTREQKTDFNHWLLTTEQLGGNSPLIIVLNKREEHEWRIDKTGLMGRYGEIIKEIKTVDLSRPEEIPELQRSVKYWFSTLPTIGDKLPESWVEIREELSKEKNEHISYGTFQGICKEYGITDIEDVRILSRYYDKIGVITHFIDDPVLQERVYIDSNWLVKTIYRLLDDEDVKKQNGNLTKRQINKIWEDNEVYPEIDKLLQLMLRFGLLFKVKGKDEYVVPEHLKQEKPYEQWPYESGEILQFQYEFGKYMPRGLMAQLIVELHHHIKDSELIWLRGVNVEHNGAKAEVVETYGQDNNFVIRVSGENRRDLLVIVREHFELIIGKFKNLKPDKRVPCNCDTCKESTDPKLHLWDELQNLSNKNINSLPCGKSSLDVDISKLLGGYGFLNKELIEQVVEFRRREKRHGPKKRPDRDDLRGRVDIRDSKVVIQAGTNIERYNQMTQEKVINIGNSNTISAPLFIADDMENCFNTVSESGVGEEVKALLTQLLSEVNDAAGEMEEGQAKEMMRDVETLTNEVTSDKPRRKWYELSVEGLKEAATAVGAVGVPILKTVAKLAPLVAVLL